jgi:signal recognition particle GTPase
MRWIRQMNLDPKRGQEMMKKLEAGIFTMRDLRDQLSQFMSMSVSNYMQRFMLSTDSTHICTGVPFPRSLP